MVDVNLFGKLLFPIIPGFTEEQIAGAVERARGDCPSDATTQEKVERIVAELGGDEELVVSILSYVGEEPKIGSVKLDHAQAPYKDRVAYARIPTIADLEKAERMDGVILVHLGHYKDYDTAMEKGKALRDLMGIPEDHPLLSRLILFNCAPEYAILYVEEYRKGLTAPASLSEWFAP